ncbi:cysteate synthase [Streptomyces sp. SID9727]|uniref:cysteate synthase n=1 Tax=Streptomyces sp. SID9727 TaxID=2706114 RepID=UPI0013DB2030|nr:cysteate synthase [Streptomyces sp. SID9727]
MLRTSFITRGMRPVDPACPYLLVCTGCDWRIPDDGLAMSCPRCQGDTLLGTEYAAKQFTTTPEKSGIFRYGWLPTRREIEGSSRPAVYRGKGFAKALGLTDLWISFSGYWPDRGCRMTSGSFKELEAFTVLGRTPPQSGVMVIASAGNTAAAFAAAGGEGVPRLIVIPARALPVVAAAIGAAGPSTDLQVVALEDATYNDVIEFSKKLVASTPGFFAEGGVRNVGRRDGLGVVALAAFEEMGALPEVYFQAVGSGAGAIAAHEASERLIASGSADGQSVPRMFLCQNADYAPLYRTWRQEPYLANAEAPLDLYAPELANATPPYLVNGGVRDILRSSAGDMLIADPAEAEATRVMFEELEGIDIERPAAVAAAALRNAVREKRISPDTTCLLNVTGGGRKRLGADLAAEATARQPAAWIVGKPHSPDEVALRVLDAFASGSGPSALLPVG